MNDGSVNDDRGGVQVERALAAFGVPREVVADKARAPVPVALCGKDDLRVLKMRTMEIYKW